MDIKKEYIRKYMHLMAVDQLIDYYKSKGYEAHREARIGDFVADVLLVKGNEKIVLEVKANKMDKMKSEKILALSEYLRKKENFKFKLVFAHEQKDKEIEIFDIEILLTEYLVSNLPGEVGILSTHSTFEEINDIDIEKIIVTDEAELLVTGSATYNARLQFGSDGDLRSNDGLISYYSFPCEFEVVFEYGDDKKLIIQKMVDFKVDTSSHYE